MTAVLATPTAVMVMTAEEMQDRRRWLAERRRGIGSSDIAAIVGVSDFGTAVHVWRDKLGRGGDDQAGEAAWWGTLLEETVAQEWCRRNRSVIERIGLIANVDEPWMLTSLDRRVRECPLDPARRQNCALEIKCRSAFKSARWHRAVPDDVLAQVAWQRRVSGYDHIHYAVLIGGNDYRQGVVHRDDELESYLVDSGRQVWEVNVGQRIEPEWDLERARQLIDLDERTHPHRSGVTETDIHGWGEVATYVELSQAKAAAEKALQKQVAVLRRLAEGRQYVKFADRLMFEVAPRSRARCDLERLAELWPDAYADCVTDTESHQIHVPKAVRKEVGE